jgi:hypothetical protein
MNGIQNHPNKWALLIGINEYPKLEARYQLRGCANDVQVMSSILQESFRFPRNHVTLLTDGEATQAGIRKAMEALVQHISPNDIVVVHYSGHGSRITDVHGDEPGGQDSTIVPHDSGRGSDKNLDITDDEIHCWLSRLTRLTPYVTLVFDCCHSGTMIRDTFGDASRWVEPDIRSAAEILAEGVAFPMEPEVVGRYSLARRDLGGSGWLPLGQGYVLLAGCRDDESSYEHTAKEGQGSTVYGAFTYFLSQELANAAPGSTYRDIYERVSARVTASVGRQNPQIEGRRDRLLFDTQDVEPLRFVPVVRHVGSVVTLGAGAAHGVTVGSQWAIYSQGTKRVVQDTLRLGTVEIVAVRAVTSDTRILDSLQIGAITEGCRAVEDGHYDSDMRLLVDIWGEAGFRKDVEGLKKRVKECQLLRLTTGEESAEMADVRLYLIAPRAGARVGDPVPELGKVERPTWAAVGRNGRLAMPPHSLDDPAAIEAVVENLEKIARYRNALTLMNPNPDSALRGKVDFVLKRQKADGTWEVAQCDPASGQTIFYEDDLIALGIVNKSGAAVYISVLDFGLTGAISLLYPPGRRSDKFESGLHAVEIFERPEDNVSLFVPEGFAYDEGVETFKLLATVGEADFSWLEQSTVREARESAVSSSPLAQLFDLAYSGTGTRDHRPLQLPANEEWTTVERTFVLRRKKL